MKTVYVYGGIGKYSGITDYQWDCPKIGGVHNFILFLFQEVNEPQQQLAINELEQFGFTELQVKEGKPIAVEALNDPRMQVFHKHYEGAFAEGSSLVWYP